MSKNDDLAQRLRPCPFCGNDGSGPIEDALQIFHSEPCDYDDRHTWSVQCDRCTATMGYSDSEDEAIEAWNRRHPDAIERGAAQRVTDGRYPSVFYSEDRQIRIGVAQYQGRDTITIQWRSEGMPKSHWRTSEFTPDEARQIALHILTKPALSTPPAPAPDAGETEDAAISRMVCAAANDPRNSPTPQPPAVKAEAVEPIAYWDREDQIALAAEDTSAGHREGLEPLYSEAALKAKTDEIERLRQECDHWLGQARSNLKAGQDCLEKLEAAEASNKALREIVPNLDHVISWLENGCDRQAAAQELRIYQSRARTLLSEQDGGVDG